MLEEERLWERKKDSLYKSLEKRDRIFFSQGTSYKLVDLNIKCMGGGSSCEISLERQKARL